MDSSGYNSIVLKYHCKVLQYFGITTSQSIAKSIATFSSIAKSIAKYKIIAKIIHTVLYHPRYPILLLRLSHQPPLSQHELPPYLPNRVLGRVLGYYNYDPSDFLLSMFLSFSYRILLDIILGE